MLTFHGKFENESPGTIILFYRTKHFLFTDCYLWVHSYQNPMKNRPFPVIIVSILFILAGLTGFFYHLKDFSQAGANKSELIWVLFLRILAVVCGLLLLFRVNLARWIAIAWLLYHVVISAFNSTSEMITHIVLLIIVSLLLFLPVSSAYFHKSNPED
jgi:hypothetical protein